MDRKTLRRVTLHTEMCVEDVITSGEEGHDVERVTLQRKNPIIQEEVNQ